jgi:hypothetical protein
MYIDALVGYKNPQKGLLEGRAIEPIFLLFSFHRVTVLFPLLPCAFQLEGSST